MRKMLGVIISGVFVLGSAVVGLVVGSDIGGSCTTGYMGCKGNIWGYVGPMCLIDDSGKGYCTVKCESDDDCVKEAGPGWGCRGSEELDENNRPTGNSKKVCYNPVDIQSEASMNAQAGAAPPDVPSPSAVPAPAPAPVPAPVPAPAAPPAQ